MVIANGRSTPDSFQQRQVPRGGAGSEEADFDILDENGTGWDLVGNGDFNIPEDTNLFTPPDIGGNGEVALGISSEDDRNFSVTIQWLNEEEVVLYEQNPAALQSTSDVFADFKVKSDRFGLIITDESGAGQNIIKGTVNIH